MRPFDPPDAARATGTATAATSAARTSGRVMRMGLLSGERSRVYGLGRGAPDEQPLRIVGVDLDDDAATDGDPGERLLVDRLRHLDGITDGSESSSSRAHAAAGRSPFVS